VFKDTYNFDVEFVHFHSREKVSPQVQANVAVTKFVAKNDQEDALFIIYYVGHGSLGKNVGDLELSGYATPLAGRRKVLTWGLYAGAGDRTTRTFRRRLAISHGT
jgi:hypothetical protein